MSPEAIELAKRRILLAINDAEQNFIESWTAMAQPFAAANSVYSSRFALTAHALSKQELQRRALIAWKLIRDVIDNEGFTPSEDNRNQVHTLLHECVHTQSEDVQRILDSRTRGLLPAEKLSLADGRAHAIESALAAFDVDVLGRVRRRLPLADELSPPRYHAAKAHWCRGLELAAKEPPDLPNALKEAVSSVESLAQIVLGKPGVTLGDAVKQLRSQKDIPPGADSVLEGLWTFANASPGARHGSSLPAHVDGSHWGFAKTTAEAGLRLLLDLDAKWR